MRGFMVLINGESNRWQLMRAETKPSLKKRLRRFKADNKYVFELKDTPPHTIGAGMKERKDYSKKDYSIRYNGNNKRTR